MSAVQWTVDTPKTPDRSLFFTGTVEYGRVGCSHSCTIAVLYFEIFSHGLPFQICIVRTLGDRLAQSDRMKYSQYSKGSDS